MANNGNFSRSAVPLLNSAITLNPLGPERTLSKDASQPDWPGPEAGQGEAPAQPARRRTWLIALGVLIGAGIIAAVVAGAVVGTRNANANAQNSGAGTSSASASPTQSSAATASSASATATLTSTASASPSITPVPVNPNDRAGYRTALRRCLSPAFNSSELVDPSNPNFSTLEAGFNSYWSDLSEPLLILLPNSNAQIAAAILCARTVQANGVATPIVARGGGHSYEGYSLVKDGIVVDMRVMNSVKIVDQANRIVDIGAGAWLGSVYYQLLTSSGWVLPGGDCPSVGIGGHSLGGGYGVLSRKWGLVSDTLVEIELVDYQGKVLIASETSEPDLFYALRGAGAGSYGIVTRFRAKAVPIAPLLSKVVWTWPAERAVEAIDTIVAYASSWPADVTPIFYVDNSGSVMLTGYCACAAKDYPLAAIEANLANMTRDGPTEYSNYLSMLYPGQTDFSVFLSKSYVDSQATGWSNNNYFKAKSYYFSKTNFGTNLGAKALLDGLRSAPAAIRSATWFQLDGYGARISTCGAPDGPTYTADQAACSSKTAFIHRDPTIVNAQMYTSWNDPGQSNGAIDFMTQWGKMVEPYSTGRSYQNYIDNQISLQRYYGAAYSRLQRIKADYDPENVFRFAQSIPTAA